MAAPVTHLFFQWRNVAPFASLLLLFFLPSDAIAAIGAVSENDAILTNLMNNFLSVFQLGFGFLLPWAIKLLLIMSTIEIVWAALYWALEGENFVPQLIQKTLVIGVFAAIIVPGISPWGGWPGLMHTIMDGFISVGARAGGLGANGAAVPDLRDPSQILSEFWRLANPIITYTSSLGIMQIGQIVMIGLAEIIMAIAVFVIAIQCALTYLEFYLVAVISMILVPFGVNKNTSFLAEKAFGAVISHGIKLAVLSFILAAAGPIIANIVTPTSGGANPITIAMAFNLDAACLLIAFIAWHAPSIAAGLFGGGPSLHAGAVSRAATGGAFLLGRMMGRSGGAVAADSSFGQVRRAAGVIGTSARGLATGTGAVFGAVQAGSTAALLGGAGAGGRALGAASGVTRLAARTAIQVGAAAVNPAITATSALKTSFRSGQVNGFKAGFGMNR